MKLNEKISKEFYEKEFKYFQVYEQYTPCYKRPPESRKFYSRYDALDLTTANEDLVRKIKIYRDKGPKDKYKWPVTENQCYGWFVEPLVELDRTDERLYFPIITDDETKHDMKIRADVTMKIEKFTGVPFKM